MYRGIFSHENKDTGVMYEICSKLIMRSVSSVLVIYFEKNSGILPVTLLLNVRNFCFSEIRDMVCWVVSIILTL